jgi:hypothetical protein
MEYALYHLGEIAFIRFEEGGKRTLRLAVAPLVHRALVLALNDHQS